VYQERTHSIILIESDALIRLLNNAVDAERNDTLTAMKKLHSNLFICHKTTPCVCINTILCQWRMSMAHVMKEGIRRWLSLPRCRCDSGTSSRRRHVTSSLLDSLAAQHTLSQLLLSFGKACSSAAIDTMDLYTRQSQSVNNSVADGILASVCNSQ